MTTTDRQADVARAAYWTALGDPGRAAADPSPESHAAWMEAVRALNRDRRANAVEQPES